MQTSQSGKCEICAAESWTIQYRGSVRDGAFGRLTDEGAKVGTCGNCGVQRLSEDYCRDDSIYESTKYREILREGTDAESFFAEHDILQLQNLAVIWPRGLRGLTVADVGCAAGSFLDHVSGLAARTIGIEPCREYHDSLRERGHEVWPDLQSAVQDIEGQVDLASTFSVIEHVSDPRGFLAGIARLLAPGGRVLVSTPNRRDVLMELLPEEYPSFFYRAVHRWYFDVESFKRCAELAGLRAVEARCVHRFGLTNAMLWLRDRRPSGRATLPGISDVTLDHVWRSTLEQRGSGDYLYFWLERA